MGDGVYVAGADTFRPSLKVDPDGLVCIVHESDIVIRSNRHHKDNKRENNKNTQQFHWITLRTIFFAFLAGHDAMEQLIRPAQDGP
jgi:hypothetical protein